MLTKIFGIVAVILIVSYVGVAVWAICTRKTIAGTIGAAAAFGVGGLMIIPVVHIIAPIVFWGVVIVVLFIGGWTMER